MNKDYVSYQNAKALKERGFNWPCTAFYSAKDKELWTVGEEDWNVSWTCYSAPDLCLIAKWLRDVKGIAINTLAHDGDFYTWEVVYLSNCTGTDRVIQQDNERYSTYEGALATGITEVLKHIIR